jgi:hypothetical protein
MQLDENNRQPLGFMELNGPELYDIVGKQYGQWPTYRGLKHANDLHNRNATNVL